MCLCKRTVCGCLGVATLFIAVLLVAYYYFIYTVSPDVDDCLSYRSSPPEGCYKRRSLRQASSILPASGTPEEEQEHRAATVPLVSLCAILLLVTMFVSTLIARMVIIRTLKRNLRRGAGSEDARTVPTKSTAKSTVPGDAEARDDGSECSTRADALSEPQEAAQENPV
ncbi:unnamed protein product [Vitrella brassicaformis CCMP3155]|uniref:Transmembrane protein n=2 Tax=Vitrella brassicaformis TaxID=1169539 RepID=A0A0G4F4Y6_VITBC|nr:unnamed protein product [Vitrella brassicaformis CCMP3155]|mmetsp:Transcript_32076/g.79503  ORF Transcript_32076/g.79503 Transcript_32076/m.79503 type:complete len:169 (+) Transcript_32076:301-807(+)|eukprot:CEM07536.1 unnamed protein product [Vitrella brassicaformis CCMP3155]